MKALDLGCGPGSLSFALAGNSHPESEITGIDISNDQLNYARKHAGQFWCKLEFLNSSMDEIPFPDSYFYVVMSSMALH
jgi:ubiquinone/menaquinone biosynthesis C-methylase UbiE